MPFAAAARDDAPYTLDVALAGVSLRYGTADAAPRRDDIERDEARIERVVRCRLPGKHVGREADAVLNRAAVAVVHAYLLKTRHVAVVLDAISEEVEAL